MAESEKKMVLFVCLDEPHADNAIYEAIIAWQSMLTEPRPAPYRPYGGDIGASESGGIGAAEGRPRERDRGTVGAARRPLPDVSPAVSQEAVRLAGFLRNG